VYKTAGHAHEYRTDPYDYIRCIHCGEMHPEDEKLRRRQIDEIHPTIGAFDACH
jgi:ribosomal protein S26